MITHPDVMSPAYLDLQKELHTRPEGYGDKGDKWASAVSSLVTRFGAKSVLDYGAGQGALVRALRALVPADVVLTEFDPAVAGKDTWPWVAHDLVVCCDVLEHVEPALLRPSLYCLRALTNTAAFAVISTRPAKRILSDGRNAHLIVESDEWWLEQLTAAGFVAEPGPKSPHPKPSRELSVVLT